MYQADEGQRRADECRHCGVGELAVDDEGRHRPQLHAGQHRPAAEHRQALIDHAHLPERGHADLVGAGAGSAQRAVDIDLGPLGDVGNYRQHYRWRVFGRARLKRLRTDHEADI